MGSLLISSFFMTCSSLFFSLGTGSSGTATCEQVIQAFFRMGNSSFLIKKVKRVSVLSLKRLAPFSHQARMIVRGGSATSERSSPR